MKRGTTPTLRVKLETDDASVFATVEFLLKQDDSEDPGVQVLKTFPSQFVTFDQESGAFLVRYTEEETRMFLPNSFAYMDVRPTLSDGTIVPTEIERVRITPTLFTAP